MKYLIFKRKFIFIILDLSLKFFNKLFLLFVDKFFIRRKLFIVFLREDRIGHQGNNADIEFLKASKRAKDNKSKTIFVFPYPKDKVANLYLRSKLIDYAKLNFFKVKVINYSNFIKPISKLIIYSIPRILDSCINIYFAKHECGPRLSNSILKTSKNNILFKNLGIKPNNFVCIYARDSKFLKSIDKDRNWDYHNYRDSDIDNFKMLAEYITDTFGWDVIRIGSDPLSKIKWESENEGKIIDYSFSAFRTDKNDIDLLSNCKLFIGYGGPASIAICSRREMIRINQVPIAMDAGYNYGIWIPKLHFINKSKKYLSLKEIFEKRLGWCTRSDDFQNSNIILKENSPEDILNVFKDYIKFKKNAFSKSEKLIIKEYHEMRKKLYSEWKFFEFEKNFISPSFLIKYENLLDK